MQRYLEIHKDSKTDGTIKTLIIPPMKKLIVFIIISFVNGNLVFAQLSPSKQIKVAETYLTLILKGQQEEAWQLFDKTNVPTVTKEQFATAFKQIKNSLALFDTFAHFSMITRSVNNRTMNMYRFRALSKSGHVLMDVFVDLTFLDTSELVGGMQSYIKNKDSTSLTSTNKETPIEKQFTAVIEDKNYNIRGINIVHLGNNIGILAIQVERKIAPEEYKNKAWTKTEAVKFAKYLVSKGYVDKAKQKAIELKLNFVEDLGVSFIDPGTGDGINIDLKPEDLK
jgi:hypothetical protein